MPRRRKKVKQIRKEPPDRKYNCINYDPCLTAAALANKEFDCGKCSGFRPYHDYYRCLESGFSKSEADDFFYIPEKICAKIGLI